MKKPKRQVPRWTEEASTLIDGTPYRWRWMLEQTRSSVHITVECADGAVTTHALVDWRGELADQGFPRSLLAEVLHKHGK